MNKVVPVFVIFLLVGSFFLLIPGVGAQGTLQDPDGVVVNQLHLFLVPMGERVLVTEYYLLGNQGDRTYVGQEISANAGDGVTKTQETLAFSLPEDAGNLRFDEALGELGKRYLPRDYGFVDTMPIPPGEATVEVRFSYTLPTWEGHTLEREFVVPVHAVVLVVSGEGMGLEGPGIVQMGAMGGSPDAAVAYTSGTFAAGESLVFTMVALDNIASAAPTVVSTTRNPTRDIGFGIIVLLLAGGLGYWLWRSPATDVQPADHAPGDGLVRNTLELPGKTQVFEKAHIPDIARPLVLGLAELDARFEAGALDDAAYAQQRAALKQELLDLIRQAAPQKQVND